mmetsp:Transcript_44672/g.138965  ORF Transcript_44672/g.138965 Transcript_44672/m.138965 type:complete len:226 (+) Transcript_44672:263-940(+)
MVGVSWESMRRPRARWSPQPSRSMWSQCHPGRTRRRCKGKEPLLAGRAQRRGTPAPRLFAAPPGRRRRRDPQCCRGSPGATEPLSRSPPAPCRGSPGPCRLRSGGAAACSRCPSRACWRRRLAPRPLVGARRRRCHPRRGPARGGGSDPRSRGRLWGLLLTAVRPGRCHTAGGFPPGLSRPAARPPRAERSPWSRRTSRPPSMVAPCRCPHIASSRWWGGRLGPW